MPVEAEKRGIDAILARLDKLQDDLEFLRLPARLRIARPLDRALSIAAQHLLRGIAWRLPGFAGSNLPYLSQQFPRVCRHPGRRSRAQGRRAWTAAAAPDPEHDRDDAAELIA